ncbi:cation-transporting P-type ATPase [Noviherbaspirillum suwonense]|uniref:ATPase, P-type (Transporting), HAD superfamily, subfamily IC n=1 Tax=Noviherbaspirillum suwonense TaxID=1224511 RepID=A0ABY1QNP4_9BURK|nr:cation-transporting P-type ATPase [Noviherbaspirillum suwonense]SMP76391.1 ATPase, P-type (transporting), HAD superfamily, subfamily IC [Noviherbaspirillum suwonense]
MAKFDQIRDPSTLDSDAIVEALGTDLQNGLTSEVASRRIIEDGPNELRASQPQPTWRRLLSHFRDPLIYLLLVAISIALVAWFIEGRAGWPTDAIVITLVVVLNGILGYLQEAKAANAVAVLAKMTAVTSAVVRDGHMMRIPSDQLVRGDLLILAEGDAVGADARLVQASSLTVSLADR